MEISCEFRGNPQANGCLVYMNIAPPEAWAQEEFGRSLIPDRRWKRRLVVTAARAARRPAGHITEVFTNAAERQGTYGLLESDKVSYEQIRAGAVQACARRCADEPFVFCPVDGTSLTLTDRAASKDFGPIGTRSQGARGIKVLNAMVLCGRRGCRSASARSSGGRGRTAVGASTATSWCHKTRRRGTGSKPSLRRELRYQPTRRARGAGSSWTEKATRGRYLWSATRAAAGSPSGRAETAAYCCRTVGTRTCATSWRRSQFSRSTLSTFEVDRTGKHGWPRWSFAPVA